MAQIPVPAPNSTKPTQQDEDQQRHLRWQHIFLYIFLIFFLITSLGPFIFSFFSSFKTFAHILDFPPSLWPQPWTWGNYKQILSNSSFLRWLLNSTIFAVGVTLLNVLFSAMAGYALGRMKFRGKEIIVLITLAVMMIPAPVTIIPKFLIVNNLHLTNTYFALILPLMVQPFSVFLMMQFLKGVPKEMEESARIDGASLWCTFYQIILPLVKPALTAVAILSFQGAWNEFLWSLLVLNSDAMYTLPVGLNFFKNAHYTEYNLLLSASMFNTIPMVILFFIFQRYFIEGISSTGVKG